ncbi:MAG TPA: hypothetical protein VLA28_07905, partial [Afifellaceae bacterium]|nr:hypothetical protein [Afifellaceae bacterium]
IAAADEMAMVALVSAPQTPAAHAPATRPVKAQEDAGARFEIASLADDDIAIAEPDRSALASLYLAAARRAAELTPGDAPETTRTGPVVTTALPASLPEDSPTVTTPSFTVAAAVPASSQASYSLASAHRRPIPAAAPIRRASYPPAALLPVSLPKAAPSASAAANAPGSAIEAANALGLMGTQKPPINPAKNIELAYASIGATTAPDGVAAKPRPRQKLATAATAGTRNVGSGPAYPAVTVNAHLTTVTQGASDLRQFMSRTTIRTRTFALLERPQPDRVPGLYTAPQTAAEAVLLTALKPPRTDRFTIDGNQLRLRFHPARLAGLY